MEDSERFKEEARFLRFFPSPEPFPIDLKAATEPAAADIPLPEAIPEATAEVGAPGDAGIGNMLAPPKTAGAVVVGERVVKITFVILISYPLKTIF